MNRGRQQREREGENELRPRRRVRSSGHVTVGAEAFLAKLKPTTPKHEAKLDRRNIHAGESKAELQEGLRNVVNLVPAAVPHPKSAQV